MASKYKCEHSISLPDALILSLAKYLDCSALFSRREREILDNILKKGFDVEILFLEDYIREK